MLPPCLHSEYPTDLTFSVQLAMGNSQQFLLRVSSLWPLALNDISVRFSDNLKGKMLLNRDLCRNLLAFNLSLRKKKPEISIRTPPDEGCATNLTN